MLSLRLFFAAQAFFLFHLLLHHTCNAKTINNTLCTSSCGTIYNISYPFRLNSDPELCGNKSYELKCENNITVLYLFSVKYYVQEINYSDFTIQLVDADVKKEAYCSIPRHSLPLYLLLYSSSDYAPSGRFMNDPKSRSLLFISCPNPVNSSFYVDSSTCSNGTNNSSFSYVKVGETRATELADSCHIELIYRVVLPNIEVNNISYKDIHDGLVYGFQLSWFTVCCENYRENRCNLDHPKSRCTNGNHITFYSIIDFFNYFVDNALTLVLTGGKYSYDAIYKTDFVLSLRNLISKLLYRPFYDKSALKVLYPNIPRWIRYLTEFFRHLFAMFVLYHSLLFLCGSPFIIALLIYKWRRRHLSVYDNIEEFLEKQNNFMPIRYSYSEIKKMTQGFKNKLGEGGYGSVYKGKLRSGCFAAIKMLGKSKANGQEFINEVATIGRIHHVNVVKLIGFCVEGSKYALIYEFMPNGSLDKFIFSRDEVNTPVSVEKMYEISLGVAYGIEYLHRGCDMQILHFDIKPHNILLDDEFIPKVSDFGLARFCETTNGIVSLTAIRGTIGYMAPELFYRNIGGVSYKADVYSFGMMLMEMAGRRKNLNTLVNSSQVYYPDWIHDQFSDGKDVELEDGTEKEKKIVKKMIIVALWCIQMKPNDRPSMYKVLKMLEREVEKLELPPKPSFGQLDTSMDEIESSTKETELIDQPMEDTNSLVIDAN